MMIKKKLMFPLAFIPLKHIIGNNYGIFYCNLCLQLVESCERRKKNMFLQSKLTKNKENFLALVQHIFVFDNTTKCIVFKDYRVI